MPIRKATTKDEKRVFELLKQFPPHEVSTINFEAASRAYQQIIQDPELGTILVAEENGEVVGVTTLSYPVAIRCGGLYSCIEENIVDERYRGKGVGGKLLKAAIAEATSKGCDEIQVNGPSEMGFPVYISKGFQDIGKHIKAKLPLQNK
jgi:GNAT superfamily N-acetyltransferase